MTLTLILCDDGRTVERHTDIGADVLTLLPRHDDDAPSPRQALHERRKAGLENAWQRRPSQAMRRRMSDQGKPLGVVEQAQQDAMAADPVNVHATARFCNRIMRDAETLPVRRGDPHCGEVLKACHAFASWYRARAATHLHPGMASQLAAIGTAYRIAANVLWDRMLRCVDGVDDLPPTRRARVIVSEPVSVRDATSAVYVCEQCDAISDDLVD
jgi:hypothetical protein